MSVPLGDRPGVATPSTAVLRVCKASRWSQARMRLRIAGINDLPIKESERKYHWSFGPFGDFSVMFGAAAINR
jgi:nuclear transport factor 2 (NTF2) superfamily protein